MRHRPHRSTSGLAVAVVAIVAVVTLLVVAGPAGAGARPILAGPWGTHQRGYGHVAPRIVDNGGDPTGVVAKIHWKHWGSGRAVGSGVGLWVGPHQIVANGTEQSVKIVAFHLGKCKGRRAYNAVEWFFPQHGEHFSAGNYINPCSGRYVRHGKPE